MPFRCSYLYTSLIPRAQRKGKQVEKMESNKKTALQGELVINHEYREAEHERQVLVVAEICL